MSQLHAPVRAHDSATVYFLSGDRMRSRSVGDVVLSGHVEIPALPSTLVADCAREALRLGLEAGDVEALSLPRARTRWPDYGRCVQAVSGWMRAQGLNDVFAATTDVALMTCRGARYHHDGDQYGGAAFCNLFLGDAEGLDLHFAAAGVRIPLAHGTVVVFDTGQPHAVVDRGRSGFDVADFPGERMCTQLFLTWELPILDTRLGRALGVRYDIDPMTTSMLDEGQVRVNGARAGVHADSGRWCESG